MTPSTVYIVSIIFSASIILAYLIALIGSMVKMKPEIEPSLELQCRITSLEDKKEEKNGESMTREELIEYLKEKGYKSLSRKSKADLLSLYGSDKLIVDEVDSTNKFRLDLSKYGDVKKFIKIASEYPDEIILKSGKYIVDAKSILGVFSLDLSKPVIMETKLKDCHKFKDFMTF